MKVYIAVGWKGLHVASNLAKQIEAAGHEVTNHFLAPGFEPGEDDLDPKHGLADMADINAADALVCITGNGILASTTGGRHFELGYAMAKGKPVAILGSVENCFQAIHTVAKLDRYADVVAWLDALQMDEALSFRADAASDTIARLTAKRDSLQARIDGGVMVWGDNGVWDDEKFITDTHTGLVIDVRPIEAEAAHFTRADGSVEPVRTGERRKGQEKNAIMGIINGERVYSVSTGFRSASRTLNGKNDRRKGTS